jgi:hypothetical protein
MDGAAVGAKIAEAVFSVATEVASTAALDYACRRIRRRSPVFEASLLYECDRRLDSGRCRPHCCLDKAEEEQGLCVSDPLCALYHQCIVPLDRFSNGAGNE